MDSDSISRYEFQPGLPVRGVEAGTNLLVSGSSGSAAREVALDLVAAATQQEGILLVSADVSGRALLDRFDESPYPVTRSMLGIVDCSGTQPHEDRRFLAHSEPISGPGDLTSIEIEFSILYDKLARQEPRGIRIGVFSLSSLLAHAPLQAVSRFLHMITGRIIATDDLGVFVVDSGAQDAVTVETMAHFCDGHVEVRDAADGGVELRVGGLDDQPETWTAVDYEVATEEWEGAAEPNRDG